MADETTERQRLINALVMTPMSDHIGTSMAPVEHTADLLIEAGWRRSAEPVECQLREVHDLGAPGCPLVPEPTEQAGREALALAWHDVTCPESGECRSRYPHAMASAFMAKKVGEVARAAGFLPPADRDVLQRRLDEAETKISAVHRVILVDSSALAKQVGDVLRGEA